MCSLRVVLYADAAPSRRRIVAPRHEPVPPRPHARGRCTARGDTGGAPSPRPHERAGPWCQNDKTRESGPPPPPARAALHGAIATGGRRAASATQGPSAHEAITARRHQWRREPQRRGVPHSSPFAPTRAADGHRRQPRVHPPPPRRAAPTRRGARQAQRRHPRCAHTALGVGGRRYPPTDCDPRRRPEEDNEQIEGRDERRPLAGRTPRSQGTLVNDTEAKKSLLCSRRHDLWSVPVHQGCFHNIQVWAHQLSPQRKLPHWMLEPLSYGRLPPSGGCKSSYL